MKRNPLANVLVMSITLLIIVGGLLFFNFRSGNVVVNYDESFKTGDKVSGTLTLNLEQRDELQKDTAMIVSLSRGNKVLLAETLTIQEFISLSGKNPKTIQKQDSVYYIGPESYPVKIESILDYTFSEPGSYEVFFTIPKIDFTIKRAILVE